MSKRSKLFLHLGYLGFDSVGVSWFQMHAAILLSSIKVVRKSMKRLFPLSVLFSLVIVSEKGTIIGFSFVKLKGRFERGGWWGELVMGLRDDHHRKGLGSKLVGASINQARSEDVKEIFLTVLKINVGAVRFYGNHGFKMKHTAKDRVRWRGKEYDNVEMWLDTTIPNPRYDCPKQAQAMFIKEKKQD
ncbi:MAG: GNAT family N-acetyltransferase [Candidatus Bathyarchaeota archaeon]|nr:MAG: GNAT family N-acetyltransferase [Candidatus Bathyarchaeota archaeon]